MRSANSEELHDTQEPSSAAPDRPIFRLTGTVRINGLPADLQTTIAPGARIETEKASEIIAKLDDLAFILRSDSELVVGDGGTHLRLVKGTLLAAWAPGAFRIETEIARILHRGHSALDGGGFYVEANERSAYVDITHGTAEISMHDDPTKKSVVSAENGDRPIAIFAEKHRLERIATARFKNHSKEELKVLQELIGLVPPFLPRR